MQVQVDLASHTKWVCNKHITNPAPLCCLCAQHPVQCRTRTRRAPWAGGTEGLSRTLRAQLSSRIPSLEPLSGHSFFNLDFSQPVQTSRKEWRPPRITFPVLTTMTWNKVAAALTLCSGLSVAPRGLLSHDNLLDAGLESEHSKCRASLGYTAGSKPFTKWTASPVQ